MKKSIIAALACCCFAVGAANAQNEAKYYGGQQGDFTFSIDAMPVINFAGNILNGTSDNELDLENLSNAISAKYFLNEKVALTAALSVDNSKRKNINYEYQQDVNFGKYETITSENTTANKDFTFGVGAQYYLRPGKRLQPFVGAGIYYGKATNITINEKFAYTYEIEKWDGTFETIKTEDYNSYLKQTNPTSTISLMANVGVELFLSEKISLSSALDLGVSTKTEKTVSKYENDNKDVTKEQIDANNYSYKSRKSTTFKTGMGLIGGNVALNFYF